MVGFGFEDQDHRVCRVFLGFAFRVLGFEL